jgi:hypothetical protein
MAYEIITKLLWLQFVIFIQYFVKLTRHDFHRSGATPQTLALAFLVLNKNSCISLKSNFVIISFK